MERILLEKKISHCYEDLKHIDVVLAVDTQHRVDMEDLKVAAKSMGVDLDIRLRCAWDLFRDSAYDCADASVCSCWGMAGRTPTGYV